MMPLGVMEGGEDPITTVTTKITKLEPMKTMER